MGYGDRYFEVDRFIDYCKKLKIETSKNELEYYEKHGLMLPVARTIFPVEYVQLVSHKLTQSVYEELLKKWPEIYRLEDRRFEIPDDFINCTGTDFIEAFDKEFDENPYLFKPTVETFKPWDSYKIIVKNEYGQDIQDSIAIPFYAYWQVHQLYCIRSRTKLHLYRSLIKHLDDERIKSWLTLPLENPTPFKEFLGKSKGYDALSFFRRLNNLERERTFTSIPEKDGIKTLTEEQFKQYKDRLQAHAQFVANRYSIDEDRLYKFLIELLELKSDYERVEKVRLAYEIEKDVWMQANFIMHFTGNDWKQIGEKLGKRTDNFVKRDFLHLDSTTKIYDVASDVLLDSIRELNQELATITASSNHIHETSAQEILEFCDKNDLDILPTTLDEMRIQISVDDVPPGEEMRKYRKTTRHTNLKNLATSFEYFLKAITKNKLPTVKSTELTPLVQEIMDKGPLLTEFNKMIGQGYHQWRNSQTFFVNLSNLKQLTTIEEFQARNFIISIAARNFSSHTFTSDDRVYGDYMGLMINSIIYSIFYFWSKAKCEHWV